MTAPAARFWMVCRSPRGPQSTTEPRQRYHSLSEARRAAQALADQTGEPFVVLEATETRWPTTGQQPLL